MALKPIALKSNTFLEVDDVKEHLRIPDAETKYDRQVARLINMVTDMMEKYISGPILVREFVDVKDGDSSDTLVPSYWPVRKLNEVRIDYDGDFESTVSVIDPAYSAVRSFPDLQVGIKGTDIVVKTDGTSSIFGHIFVGSTIQSIQVKYDAGLGLTADSVPEDIKYAALLAIEYFYIARENRELAISSKTNNNQSYTRTPGLPKEVRDMLDPYVDHTLGIANRPQKNTFST
jgi:hypothetical protein